MRCVFTSVLLSKWPSFYFVLGLFSFNGTITCFWNATLTYCLLSSLLAPTETVKQIIINIEAGVEVEVTIAA